MARRSRRKIRTRGRKVKHHLSSADKNVIILMIALIAVIILFVVIQSTSLNVIDTSASGQVLNPAAEDVTITEGAQLTSSQTDFEVMSG